jgi:hypothetical protein
MIPTADRSIPTGTLRSVTPAMAYVVVNIASSTVVGAVQISVPLYALQLEASVAEIGLVRGMSYQRSLRLTDMCPRSHPD